MKKITLIFILLLCFPAISNAKNCKKGIACGNTCISANKICHIGTSVNTNNGRVINSNDYTIKSISTLNNQTTNKQNFDNAKTALIKIYKEHPEQKEFYCGCDFSWTDKLSTINLNSCGYLPRKNQNRAERIEWEHVMPAENFGRQLKCWKDGGRKACKKYIAFNKMEGDMHNLQPAIGEVNGDRSNYAYNQFTKDFNQYGQCNVATDFKNRQFQPRDESKGVIARTYLYMSNKYDIRLSQQDQRLMASWNKMYPPTIWECERNQIIKQVQGNDNHFITNECKSGQ